MHLLVSLTLRALCFVRNPSPKTEEVPLKPWFKSAVFALAVGYSGFGNQTSALALSESEQVWFKNAIKAIKAKQWKSTGRFSKRIKSPLARKYLAWSVLGKQNSISSFSLIDGFLAENPNWPLRRVLLRRAEQLMKPDMEPER